ncbi:Hypothetical protein HP17_06777 [Helicobacter pylori NCTC 11637 = CCUG 17874 = ATCC 43504 = JCM 12093]|nr:Hypothetical protein HP17_06777 [Helicobacter pylori NCTC 11637 = CCUG 17874 = ATCC 43504 = JCM 12093]
MNLFNLNVLSFFKKVGFYATLTRWIITLKIRAKSTKS